MNNLRIALDIDDTILKWFEAYQNRFPGERNLVQHIITRNVRKLQYDREFWENLELLERPNFEPHIYSTKRINQKSYTRNSLIKNGLPIKPIYQTYNQNGNKAEFRIYNLDYEEILDAYMNELNVLGWQN